MATYISHLHRSKLTSGRCMLERVWCLGTDPPVEPRRCQSVSGVPQPLDGVAATGPAAVSVFFPPRKDLPRF